jgi:peptidyl-prolyl cis-trans isomerase D
MATLEKIRNRAGVLVAVIIGIALLAFILGDFLNSGKTLFSSSEFEIAEISGKSVPYQKYQKEIDEIVEINKFTTGQSALDEETIMRIREQTWQQMVREYILEDEFDRLGVNVTSQELWDMIMGENIHPIIQQLFANPETGQVNTINLLRFLKSYDQDPTGQQKTYWLFIENQLEQERLFNKYSTLIKKGLYATNQEAMAEMKRNGRKVDFDFVLQPYNTVSDSLVKVTSSELKEYYEKHKNDYKQTASRNIEYISFDITPSEADKKDAENWISNISYDFSITENDKEFVNANSDVAFDNSYYKKDELPENVKELFDSKVGTTVGPYFDNDVFKISKLSEVKNIPDSVKARHILIQPAQEDTDYRKLYTLADSLKKLLEKGANFADLAKTYSTDRAANEKGGDLGWFKANEMVSPFSDTCFISKVGQIKLVATNYGLHIVEVTNRSSEVKKVKLATIGRKLEPSSETVQQTYALASQFAGSYNTYDKFTKAIDEQKITKRVASLQEADQQIAGLENPREFIRSVFETELKDIVKSRNQESRQLPIAPNIRIFNMGNLSNTMLHKVFHNVSQCNISPDLVRLCVLTLSYSV